MRRAVPFLAPALLAACAAAAQTAAPPPGARPDWEPVRRLLDSAVAAGAAPGAVLGVSHRGTRMFYGTGRLGEDLPRRPDSATVYDLASLTKVVALTTGLMLAVDEARLGLDDPVGRLVPAFAGPGKDAVTVRHLLTHTGGLPAGRPLFRETDTRAEALALTDTTALESVPGSRYRYSDLGAIVLTQVLEAATGEPLDRFVTRRVFAPLGLASMTFRPPAVWRERIAPTERDPWRGRMLRGEVHDENAARLEGVSGHAGLFGSAEDLLTFGAWLLAGVSDCGRCGPAAATPPPPSARSFVRRQDLPPGSSRALGWDTPSAGSSAGIRLSPTSFGHTGFTGTSIWVDPSRELVLVLLTNRVHPSRTRQGHIPLRRAVADAVAEAVDGVAR